MMIIFLSKSLRKYVGKMNVLKTFFTVRAWTCVQDVAM